MIFRKCFFLANYFLIQIVTAKESKELFAEDYFFGENMRAVDKNKGHTCKDITTLKKCNERCEDLLGICYKKECYCVVRYNSDSASYTKPIRGQKHQEFYPRQRLPTRRHHIAHFCPNLEVARVCIRKCMKEGKPAFCGKDHVCYCSHRYDGTNKKDEINATAIKIGFYDLYAKYFGPQFDVTEKPYHSPEDHDNNDEGDADDPEDDAGDDAEDYPGEYPEDDDQSDK